ncbi:MAG TPA: hypothetical protein VFS63_15865 [Pseudolabrys sp.]|nr:hypothetical protein [Pseudolabrys sp.]
MPTTEFAVIDHELTSRLGQITINWACIEEWLGHLLATLIDADSGGFSIITAQMGASAIIDAIKTVIALHEPKDPSLKEVREMVEQADELRIERNEFIHGIWDPTGCEPHTCLINTFGWKRAEIIRGRLVTAPELDEFLIDCQDWLESYVELGKRFGFPRNRGETSSIFRD